MLGPNKLATKSAIMKYSTHVQISKFRPLGSIHQRDVQVQQSQFISVPIFQSMMQCEHAYPEHQNDKNTHEEFCFSIYIYISPRLMDPIVYHLHRTCPPSQPTARPAHLAPRPACPHNKIVWSGSVTAACGRVHPALYSALTPS
jgi:hypothetical protein